MVSVEVEPVVSPHNARVIHDYLVYRKPFFVEGGPGIGKSLAVTHFGRQVYRTFWSQRRERGVPSDADGEPWEPLKIDITEDTEVRHLLGEMDWIRYFAEMQAGPGRRADEKESRSRFFVPGPVTRAIMEGRLLIVEELDRAGRETLFPVFFDAIEYRRVYVPELGRTVTAGDNDFNIVITVNRFTDIGTVSLPKALLRRPRCVPFYDPSRELGVNRAHAVRYETRIVMANVQHVLEHRGLSPRRARAFILPVLDRVIFGLRAAGEMDEPPTPSETAMWFLDMFECDGERLLDEDTPEEARLAICLRFRGAIVKSAGDDERFIASLTSYFLGPGRPARAHAVDGGAA